jgi:acetyl esterase/lipase
VGNKETEVHHNGRNNTLAALEWAYANFTSPEKILVSGESAGGFASAYWAPFIAEHYKDNEKIYQLTDCSQLTTNRWPEIMDSVWKSDTRSFLNFKVDRDAYADALLNRTDSAGKQIKHLNSNTLYDAILPRFYAVLQHRSTSNNDYIYEWSKGMRESVARLADGNINYEYFVTDCRYDSVKIATPHTLLGSDSSLYACNSGELTYVEWLRQNIIEDKPVSAGEELLQLSTEK